ncbi:phage portal protein [Roseomonas gilardii]|uniref:phage portal protein n=1 Tax=Roseomonas gilardii TaxID=257708 RepID=UPI0004B2FA3D|nr:phage portal protein [Roseomonas gilardii]SUE63511.1 phage portal protein, lambda family [Roseomonas gilardii subsp. rosea]
MGRLRDAWNVLRGYAAAQDQRASAWAASGGSANAEVGMAAATVARRARDAVRNDPYASRIVDLWTGNAVGAGITTRWPDQRHADAWRRWAESNACDAEGRLDLYGLQALAMRAVVESGECFVRFLMVRPSLANPIGLRLQMLEADHLDTARNGMVEGAPTIQGIALGEAGAPIGYWLHRVHPGTAWLLPGAGLASDRIPAGDVLHIYRKRRPGQLRDVSWLAPVLLRLRDLGDYEAALLMKAKIEACLAAVVTEDGDEALTGAASGLLRDAQGRAVESFEPGMILYRRGMGSVEVVNPSGGGSHAAFARRALEAAAVGAGLTYDQVSGDLTQANYSSLRAGKIEFRRLCEQVQYGMLIPMLVRPIADRFHAQGALLGLWGTDMPDGVSHVPPAHEMIDPLKDTTALIAQVRAGFVPQPEAAGAFGYDFRQAVEMIREANALLDEAGISLDTDPRRVAKSGAAQDAAQLAAIEIAATGAASPRADESADAGAEPSPGELP